MIEVCLLYRIVYTLFQTVVCLKNCQNCTYEMEVSSNKGVTDREPMVQTNCGDDSVDWPCNILDYS